MKRKAKVAVGCAAAAMLTMGAAFTSMAEWQQEDGIWIYTDNNGNRVTDSWRQSGSNYFYLDSEGVMATDRWVDDTYYVDINGVRAVSYTHLDVYKRQHRRNSPEWFKMPATLWALIS